MRILIAGGTGFLGKALTEHYLAQGHRLVILGRSLQTIKDSYGLQVEAHTWENFNKEQHDLMPSLDLIINLAGANIAAKRWSIPRKEEILASRVTSTKLLAGYCAQLGKHSPPLFNASAVSIYGKPPEGDALHAFSEDTPLRDDPCMDFLCEIARAWEQETRIAKDQGVRVVNMRFAVVLAKGGLLKKLLRPYSLGLGGPIGSGKQPFAWISLHDLIAAIDFLLKKSHLHGAINFAAPECIFQRQFAKALGKTLHRPALLRLPGVLAEAMLGHQMAQELLLHGQCACPKVLLDNGFHFKYPTIEHALQAILA